MAEAWIQIDLDSPGMTGFRMVFGGSIFVGGTGVKEWDGATNIGPPTITGHVEDD